MKQYDYRGVVIRPRLETFEQYHETEINRYKISKAAGNQNLIENLLKKSN